MSFFTSICGPIDKQANDGMGCEAPAAADAQPAPPNFRAAPPSLRPLAAEPPVPTAKTKTLPAAQPTPVMLKSGGMLARFCGTATPGLTKQAVIKQEGDEWLLYTKDGKRVLGRHGSKQEAILQEYAIQKSQDREADAEKSAAEMIRKPRTEYDDHCPHCDHKFTEKGGPRRKRNGESDEEWKAGFDSGDYDEHCPKCDGIVDRQELSDAEIENTFKGDGGIKDILRQHRETHRKRKAARTVIKSAAAKCPGCGKEFPKGEPLPDVEMCETCERYGPSKSASALVNTLREAWNLMRLEPKRTIHTADAIVDGVLALRKAHLGGHTASGIPSLVPVSAKGAALSGMPASGMPLIMPAQDPVTKSAAIAAAIRKARNETHQHPTPAQRDAGNYKKGRVNFKGIQIAIENPVDSIRRGTTKEGKKWETKMTADYGYVVGTEAGDGDEVDMFIGDDLESDMIVAVDQWFDGKFDETKFIVGVPSQEAGEQLYLSNYQKGWKLGPVSTTTVPQFKQWLKDGDHAKPFKGQMVKAARWVSVFAGPV